MKRCPFCAEEIQDAAIVCRFCNRELARPVTPATAASPQPRNTEPGWGRREVKWLTGTIVAFVSLLSLLFIIGSQAPASETMERSAAIATAPPAEQFVEVTGAELVQAYMANEISADRTYKDVRLRIRGVVADISKDILGSPFLVIDRQSDGIRAVQASFPRSAEAALAAIRRGTYVYVTCTGAGLMMNVQVKNCELVSTQAR